MTAAVLCRRLFLFKAAVHLGRGGAGKWQAVAVATLTGGTACWTRCGGRSTAAGRRRRIRTAAWRSTRFGCPDTVPLVYVPYLTGADPGSPILQADSRSHRIRAGSLQTHNRSPYM